jgi:hypothetical protein
LRKGNLNLRGLESYGGISVELLKTWPQAFEGT